MYLEPLTKTSTEILAFLSSRITNNNTKALGEVIKRVGSFMMMLLRREVGYAG